MRHPEPYYRANRGTWYVQIGKTQHRLVHGPREETEAEAFAIYHALMVGQGRELPREELTLAVACELFLRDAAESIAAATHTQYRIKLQSLSDRFGRLRLGELKPEHVADWLKGQAWADSTKRGAITAAKVCLAWCVRRGYLPVNPLKDVKRPRMARRERTVTPAERARIRERFDPSFAIFLDALTWTGCRPGEIMRLEAVHLDLAEGYAALPGKTTSTTGELVRFPLVAPMLDLCRRLAAEHPSGPIFLNRDGNPWTVNAVRCRMRRMRKALGIEGVTAYTFRHSYATDALERGVPITDVAALMNHRDIRTTMCYNHIRERREHLKAQAEKARGNGKPSS